MTRYNRWAALAAVCATVAALGLQCSAGTTKFTLKRFSSIPQIVRWTVFEPDGSVTILDPPNTDKPFTFTMSSQTRDTLQRLCSAYPSFDTSYFPDRPIPNPASRDLVFEQDGKTKLVHIVQFPPLPKNMQALLEYAGRIEFEGLELMRK